MTNGTEQTAEERKCEHPSCDRQPGRETGRCFWHAEVSGKTLDETEQDLRGLRVKDAYLRGADLSGADFAEAHLPGADLREADLRGAELPGAYLSEADLRWVDLREADLRWADLSEATLWWASLEGVNLTEADLSGAHLREVDLSEADLTKATFSGAELSEITLSGTDLTGVEHAQMIEAALTSSADLTRGAGVDAAAVLATQRPSETVELVDPLLAVLEQVEMPSIQATVVRTLATTATETGTSISGADNVLARSLRFDEELVREEAATNLSVVVMNNPQDYPKTLEAYQDALNHYSSRFQLAAAKTLAVVAHESPETLSDLDDLHSQLKTLRYQPDLPADDVERAVGIVDEARSASGASAR